MALCVWGLKEKSIKSCVLRKWIKQHVSAELAWPHCFIYSVHCNGIILLYFCTNMCVLGRQKKITQSQIRLISNYLWSTKVGRLCSGAVIPRWFTQYRCKYLPITALLWFNVISNEHHKTIKNVSVSIQLNTAPMVAHSLGHPLNKC